MRFLLLVLGVMLFASPAWSQQMAEALAQGPGSLGEGWSGFTDIAFLVSALGTLTTATVLAAAIAYHPKHRQTADTLEEIRSPKIFITYSVIGAIIGIIVVKYGLVVGFVLFGIGGLIRFRTILGSASLTGRVIFVTLIGLSCGLDLPHVAVLSTVFGFVLIYILDSRITYIVDIRALPAGRVAESAAAYRALLEEHGCNIVSERKNPGKKRAVFVFQSPDNDARLRLEKLLETSIDESLAGSVDWEID